MPSDIFIKLVMYQVCNVRLLFVYGRHIDVADRARINRVRLLILLVVI